MRGSRTTLAERLEVVFTLVAVLELVHFLGRGDQRAVFCYPGLPHDRGVIGRSKPIVRRPEALVFLGECVSVRKVALHHCTSEGLGSPEQTIDTEPFPLPQQLGSVGTVRRDQAIGMERLTIRHRVFCLHRGWLLRCGVHIDL